MQVIGAVVRLQVQRDRLKPGPAGARIYDPAPLWEVEALELGPRGVWGLTGDARVLDVHHADHPQTRNVALLNGVSVMTTGRYADLRARFGAHLVDGIAGESVLVDADVLELPGPVVLETDGGLHELVAVPIPPCVEFSRWVLGRDVTDTGPEVLAALAALGEGARGYYLRPADAVAASGVATAVLRPGHRLLLP